jgi:UDP-N-acetylglucosamine transferase subunit ALG13
VFDDFRSSPRCGDERPVRRVAVVLGTWTQAFGSLVDRLLRILPQDVQTMWQTGFTDVTQINIQARPWLSPEDLAAELRRADVVVMHAGMGATLDALEAGHCPVVIPRRKAAGEQVDDHQIELANELDRRDLAVVRLPETLQWEDLVQAARRRVSDASIEAPAPFVLR